MWLFGYGSLIWDGWEIERGCLRRMIAELHGFRRVFNKGSVKNWGSKDAPCPTLNLAPDPSKSCKGIAFEFPEENQQSIVDYLRKREGKGFDFQSKLILLNDGARVSAIVPIYSGKNLLVGRSLDEFAAMASAARGTNGCCIDYIINVATKLTLLGINDPDVDAMRRALTVERAL